MVDLEFVWRKLLAASPAPMAILVEKPRAQ